MHVCVNVSESEQKALHAYLVLACVERKWKRRRRKQLKTATVTQHLYVKMELKKEKEL